MGKIVDNVIRIPCKKDSSFFRMWLLFLKPFHNLTDREMDLAAAILKSRMELSKSILDKDILNKVLFSRDNINKILKECNMNLPYYNVLKAGLKKGGFYKDGIINPRYIPNVSNDASSFKMMLFFDFRENKEKEEL